MSKVCNKCGAELEDKAIYCDECGAKYEVQNMTEKNVQVNTKNHINNNVQNMRKKNPVATASLILGIIAVLTSIMCIGIFPAVIGITLAVIALNKKDKPKGKAIAGLILSIVGFLIAIFFIFIALCLADEDTTATQPSGSTEVVEKKSNSEEYVEKKNITENSNGNTTEALQIDNEKDVSNLNRSDDASNVGDDLSNFEIADKDNPNDSKQYLIIFSMLYKKKFINLDDAPIDVYVNDKKVGSIELGEMGGFAVLAPYGNNKISVVKDLNEVASLEFIIDDFYSMYNLIDVNFEYYDGGITKVNIPSQRGIDYIYTDEARERQQEIGEYLEESAKHEELLGLTLYDKSVDGEFIIEKTKDEKAKVTLLGSYYAYRGVWIGMKYDIAHSELSAMALGDFYEGTDELDGYVVFKAQSDLVGIRENNGIVDSVCVIIDGND